MYYTGVTPNLIFTHQAQEAVRFYVSIFDNSRIVHTVHIAEHIPGGMAPGSVLSIQFELDRQPLSAANGGPSSGFTPALSLYVGRESEREVRRLFDALSAGGEVLVPLQEYPPDGTYGWINDRFGVSWQMHVGRRTEIIPYLLFVGAQHGKAEEAIAWYTSLIKNSGIEQIARYGDSSADATNGELVGTVRHATFLLSGQRCMAEDSGLDHHFTFASSTLLQAICDTQQELDALWEGLSTGGTTKMGGVLVDRYGVSWQVIPAIALQMINNPEPAKSWRAIEAIWAMEKIDIDTLKQAYNRP